MKKKALVLTVAATFGLTGAAMAGITFELEGLSSNDLQGNPINNTLSMSGFSFGDVIAEVHYDVNVTGVGVSWFEEATYSLWDGSVGGALVADGSGGALSFAPGAQTSFFVNSAAAGTHDIADYVMTTDTLVLELHEWNFDDNPDGPDAIYNAGSTITIWIPAPPSLALLGVVGLIGRGRRRRR